MTNKKAIVLALAALMTVLFAGCDNKKEPARSAVMPEVTDANCTPASVANVDASVRQQFADACARRGTFKPSTGKSY